MNTLKIILPETPCQSKWNGMIENVKIKINIFFSAIFHALKILEVKKFNTFRIAVEDLLVNP